jgi:hypothetical protein
MPTELIKIPKIEGDKVREGGHVLNMDLPYLEMELRKLGHLLESEKVVQYNINNEQLQFVIEKYKKGKSNGK